MVKEASIIAIALVIAGVLVGGRYEVAGTQMNTFRVDKWTGAVVACSIISCGTVEQQ